MRTVAKCAAIASVVLLTAGSAAWAQGYGNNAGNYGNQGYNQGYNPGYQGANTGNWGNNQGSQGANGGNWGGNQAGWGQGMQGSSGQYSENTGAGSSSSNNTNYAFAQRELAQYGYTDIHNLRPTQGWSADTMKNGRMVHVILGENGLVSTFRGE